MKKSGLKLLPSSVLVTAIALNLFCIGFDSPASPDKTNASIVLMSSTSKTFEGALTDSVGKEIGIGFALYLPVNFDSVNVQVLDNGNIVIDSVCKTFRSDFFKDTIWIKHTFLKPGVKNVTVTPYSTPQCPSMGATITIYGVEQIPEDKTPPAITFVSPSDTNAAISADTFTVDLLCSDSSGVASVSASMGSKIFQSILVNGHYTVQITGFNRGEINVVTITAMDSSVTGNAVSRKLYFNYLASGYSVKYQKGTDVAGALPADSRVYQSGEQVIVLGNTGNLTKSGYTFYGWNTKEDGTGAAYTGGTVFQMGNTDVVLFAQWTTMPVYKVVYNGNGHTGGDVPVDSNNYLLSAKVTVKDNSGSLSKSGATFIGWNTAADGSGTAYAAGVSFAMGSADVILYAQWTIARYTVTFNSMEGSAVAAQTIDHGGKVTEPAAPVRSGYTFGGWYKEAAYTTQWNFTTEMVTASDTLFAKWVAVTYTVTFDGQSVVNNSTKIVTSPATTVGILPVPAAAGYQFGGWFTSINGGGTPFLATTMVTGDITVFANWIRVYKVTYNVNTGNGTPPVDPNTYSNSSTVAVLSGSGLSKENYTFTGWNTQADTLGTSYTGGGTFQMGSVDVVLYAKWRMNVPTISTLANKTCPVNDSVTFSVTATGADLSYAWQLNGTPIEGATKASYTTSKLTVADVSGPRSYTCVVANLAGRTNSSATLSISTVNDADGNVYHEVRMGTQIWMMENLKTTKYRDGSRIGTQSQDAIDWTYKPMAYTWPQYNESNRVCGMLYNWNCVNNGILPPAGWRIATEDDWSTLFTANSGCDLYDPDYFNVSIDWGCSAEIEPNNTGFTAIANGTIDSTGEGGSFMSKAYWWASKTHVASMEYSRSWSMNVSDYNVTPYNGYGIRCIKE